jgi:RNAse (barnase) inhibitor barstar
VKTISIDCNAITDWTSFHRIFSDTFGFPGYYGQNMNAWIDCLTYLDEPETGMCTVSVEPEEVLTLILENAKSFKSRLPEIYDALIECAAFVNWRRIEHEEPSVLTLAFYG